MAHRPIDAPGADGLEDGLSSSFTELLGVPEPSGLGAFGGFGRDHSDADGDRPGPRTATNLVHAGDARVPTGAQGAFFGQIRRA